MQQIFAPLTALRHKRSMASSIALFLIALCAENTLANSCFDDKDLDELHSNGQQRGTLIYIWSPRMVYSVHNMPSASQAAAAAGLAFVALHDMRVPESELPPVPVASRALCSSQLIQREALRHFPTAFLIQASGIHPYPIVGAMPWGAWVSSIDQRSRQP